MDDLRAGRGEAWDHDPGPPRNRRWARLFAEIPDYRGLGGASRPPSGAASERFRWQFGPVFYRGRLGDRPGPGARRRPGRRVGRGARPPVVRGRVGHPGAAPARPTSGIARSYLFLNTFVYSITGQFGGLLEDLALDPDSPIARHRTRLFDYAAERNDLRLVVAVGRAARESVLAWNRSRGGTGDAAGGQLHELDATALGPQRPLRRRHAPGRRRPGRVVRGGGLVRRRGPPRPRLGARHARPGCPPTPGASRGSASGFRYERAPIPLRDLPFGTPWRLGSGGTGTTRRDEGRSIELEPGVRQTGEPSYPGRACRWRPRRLRRRARRPAVGAAPGRRRVRPRAHRGDGPPAGRRRRRAGLARLRRPRRAGRGHLRRRARCTGAGSPACGCSSSPTRRATTTWCGAGPSPARPASASRACWRRWASRAATWCCARCRSTPPGCPPARCGRWPTGPTSWHCTGRWPGGCSTTTRSPPSSPSARTPSASPAGSTSTASRSCRCRPWSASGARAAWVAGHARLAVARASRSTSRPRRRAGTANGRRSLAPTCPSASPAGRARRATGSCGRSGCRGRIRRPSRRTRCGRPGGWTPSIPTGPGARAMWAPGPRKADSDMAERTIFEGRVVTMNGRSDVHDPGRVYVDGHDDRRRAARGEAGARRAGTTPASSAPATRSTPGLIELHNHLSYNALPLWQTPQRFTNRGQWMRHRDYRRFVSGPASVLGRTGGFLEAVVRYVEAKCLRRRRDHVAGHRAGVEHGHPPLLQGSRPQRRGRPATRPCPRRPPAWPTSRPAAPARS